MNWKEFLKPDWRKIVIFIILTSVLMIYSHSFLNGLEPDDDRVCCECETATCNGFPFIYIFEGCVSYIVCYDTTIYWTGFILDIIVWSLISFIMSCLLVWVFFRVKGK
jgi:hypothetical protein